MRIEMNERNINIMVKVVLDYMDDIQAPPVGTQGIVQFVDSIGQIHVRWENGSSLALIPEVDKYHFIEVENNVTIKK